jgi:hypothetical protein
MSILFQWSVDHLFIWPFLLVALLIIGNVAAWWGRTVRTHVIMPLRLTNDPYVARRYNTAKLSKRLVLWSFVTWATLAETGVFILLIVTRGVVEPEIVESGNRTLAEVAVVIISIVISSGVTLLFLRWIWDQPIRLFCPWCNKYVPGDLPWICGQCHSENDPSTVTFVWEVAGNSFLHKCKTCKTNPVAFLCPHCQDVFILDGRWHEADKAEARRLAASAIQDPPPPPESNEEKRERYSDAVENLEHRITITELETRLAQRTAELDVLRTPRIEKAAPTAREKLRQTYDRHHDELLAVHEIAKEARAKAEEKFHDDPEMLEMEDAVIQQFVEKHGMG